MAQNEQQLEIKGGQVEEATDEESGVEEDDLFNESSATEELGKNTRKVKETINKNKEEEGQEKEPEKKQTRLGRHAPSLEWLATR